MIGAHWCLDAASKGATYPSSAPLLRRACAGFACERGTRVRAVLPRLGVKENRCSRYEEAETEPDLITLHRMCDTLRVRPEELFGYDVTEDQQVSRLARQQCFQRDGARLRLLLKAMQPRVTESLAVVDELWTLDNTS